MHSNEKGESRGRGFAEMDHERQRQISSQGGRAAHEKGTAHEFDSDEAREAGRKGGLVTGGRRRARELANTLRRCSGPIDWKSAPKAKGRSHRRDTARSHSTWFGVSLLGSRP